MIKTASVPSEETVVGRLIRHYENAESLATSAVSSPRAVVAILVAIVALTLALYPAYVLATVGSFGFPLDDSWIYQHFARNLARYGSMVYNPGVPAAGATSILWVPIMALAYSLAIDPIIWTYICGAGAVLGLALASYAACLALFPERRGVAIVASIAIAADWRMAWSALSGMETALFTFVSIALLAAVARKMNSLIVGLIGGILVVARPEGLLLVSIVVASNLAIASAANPASRLIRVAGVLLGLGVALVPYFLLNWSLTGNWMPTTFYAKQALYAGASPSERITYLFDALRMLLIGPSANAIFAVGAPFAAYKAFVSRNWRQALPLTWAAALLIVYALRLPVSFQHGRYFMPLVPIAIMYSVAGTSDLLLIAKQHSYRALPVAFSVLAGIVVIVSWAIGARILATDIGIINSQQVQTARWIEANTPRESIIATHDIGALAYFSNRRIIDTTGLIDPDFIPVVHDSNATLTLAIAKGADYFAFFPDWYPRLTAQLKGQKVFQANGDYLNTLGFKSMVLYHLD